MQTLTNSKGRKSLILVPGILFLVRALCDPGTSNPLIHKTVGITDGRSSAESGGVAQPSPPPLCARGGPPPKILPGWFRYCNAITPAVRAVVVAWRLLI